VTRLAALAVLAAALAGCGGTSSAAPTDDPGAVAKNVLRLIVNNRYTEAWDGLHPADQAVAPRTEYVGCESRSPVIAKPLSVKVVRVVQQSVGLGDGRFLDSTAVDLRLGFAGGFHLVHTVHLIASGGKWRWILPSWRYRDYKADRCPTDAGSTPSPNSA
jgi:hypothetical protein